jgi:hypothetical protein
MCLRKPTKGLSINVIWTRMCLYLWWRLTFFVRWGANTYKSVWWTFWFKWCQVSTFIFQLFSFPHLHPWRVNDVSWRHRCGLHYDCVAGERILCKVKRQPVSNCIKCVFFPNSVRETEPLLGIWQSLSRSRNSYGTRRFILVCTKGFC